MIALMINFDLCEYMSTYVIKNNNSFNLKIYFHSVKIDVYSVRNLYLSSIIGELNKPVFFFHKAYFKPKTYKTITSN